MVRRGVSDAVAVRCCGIAQRASAVLVKVAAWALLGVLCGAVAVFVVLPKLIGGQALTVETGSMAPTLPVGSIVVERPADPGTLRAGDVATYRLGDGRGLVTHRIVAVSAQHRQFVFRGDANPVADAEPVTAAAVTGREWFDVPYAGTLRARLGRWRAPLIVLAVLGLGIYFLGRVGRGRRPATAWAASSTARPAPRRAAARTARWARGRAR